MSRLEVVLVDEMMSRIHAQIQISHEVVTISDHGSTNGTFANAERIVRETRLDAGDRILVGTSIMKLTTTPGSGPDLGGSTKAVGGNTKTKRYADKNAEVFDVRSSRRDSDRGSTPATVDYWKSGVLTLQADSEFGNVYLSKVEILGAVVERSRNMPGREAFLEIFTWRTGVFEFIPTDAMPSPIPGAIEGATEPLLKEGLRALRRS